MLLAAEAVLGSILVGPPAIELEVVEKDAKRRSSQEDAAEADPVENLPLERVLSVTAKLVVDCNCELGECVLYDEVCDKVLWTDIYGRRFYRLALGTAADAMERKETGEECSGVRLKPVRCFDLPKQLCAFSLLPPGATGYLFAWEDGFQLFEADSDEALSQPSSGPSVRPPREGTRLNDGRVDVDGRRFVCGGYYGEFPDVKMQVFKCEMLNVASLRETEQDEEHPRCLVHSPILDEIQVTNSICFSLDGTVMYIADSPTRSIFQFDYDRDTGELSNRQLFHVASTGVPDGSCVDEEGYIWNAVWREGEGPGMVNRLHPWTGEIVFTVHMPDSTSQVSCCCFGGEDLNVLFITTAAVGRDRSLEPSAGALYAVKLPFRGRKESRFGTWALNHETKKPS